MTDTDTIERQLQVAINHLSHWALENRFLYSTFKTRVHFTHLQGLQPHPAISK
jgi:hypothetical protein